MGPDLILEPFIATRASKGGNGKASIDSILQILKNSDLFKELNGEPEEIDTVAAALNKENDLLTLHFATDVAWGLGVFHRLQGGVSTAEEVVSLIEHLTYEKLGDFMQEQVYKDYECGWNEAGDLPEKWTLEEFLMYHLNVTQDNDELPFRVGPGYRDQISASVREIAKLAA